MENHLLFGTAYYPEYMPYDRIETDISMMKQAGMNVVRIAESTWSTLEPSDSKFCFDFIDRVLDELEKRNMYAIIGTPTYAIPSWLSKKDSDIMVTTKKGQANYGHRQQMNIVSSVFRFYAERMIRKLLEHTVSRPCVIGFQIDNETKHYGTLSHDVQRLFIEQLKQTFHTTEQLNKTFFLAYWSNSISDWNDFPDMNGCIHAGLCSELEKFQRKLAAEYLDWQAKIVLEYKREEQFITHNFDFEWKKFGAKIAQDGYSYGVQPDINHYQASQYLTLAGTDIYHPTQDELTGAEIAFGGDSIRSLKYNNYLVLECQAQAFKYWTPYPKQLRLHAYSHLASGAEGILYWNWHSIHNGYETYWKGLLSHDLEVNPTYEEACLIGQEWNQLGGEQLILSKQNKVALLVDNVSLTALNWFPIDKDLTYNDVVRWMYDCLYEENIECDIVDVHALDTQHYRIIITPALYSADEDLLCKLKNFVWQGGILISSFRSFVANEYLSVYYDTQPHLLHDCFGMYYNQFTEPKKATLKGYPITYFAELLQVKTAQSLANYEHTYWGSYAAITKNNYGKGSAYYIGCYTDKSILKEIYAQAIKEANLEIPSFSFPIIVRSGRNKKGRMIHYVLNYSEQNQLFCCPYYNVTNCINKRSYQLGETIPLNDWDVLILKE